MAYEPTITRRDAQYLLLIAALPILGYQFGLGNQVEQWSLVRRLADPNFLPDDFYVNSAAGFGPRYYYALLLSWLTSIAPLPLVMFVMTYATNLALAAITYDAVRRNLGADRVAAALGALLAITNSSFSLGLAGFLRFESYQPANLAIPLALLGLSWLARGWRWRAASCFAFSAMFHPLIGVEVAAIAYSACGLAELVRARSAGAGAAALLRFVPSGLLFCAVIFLAWVLPSLVHPTVRIPDAEFFQILAVFRAPHHYLARAFPLTHYLTAIAFVAALAYLLRGYVRANGPRFEVTAFAFTAAIVVGLCVTSAILVDLAESRLFTTAQVFRMLLLVKWIGFLFFAWTASQWVKDGNAVHWVAAAAPVIVAGEGQPVVMVAAVLTVAASRRLNLKSAGVKLAAALLALFSAAVAYKAGAREEMVRAAVGAVCLWLFFGPGLGQPLYRAGAAVLAGSLIAFGWVNRDLRIVDFDAFRPTYTWSDLKEPDADIARWAKVHTPSNSVWLTPPDFERFRLIAERAIVTDFTSIPFDDVALREWKARMAALYGEVEGAGFAAQRAMDRNYRASTPAGLRAAGARFHANYAVLYTDTHWPGPVLYRNATYKAVPLAEQ